MQITSYMQIGCVTEPRWWTIHCDISKQLIQAGRESTQLNESNKGLRPHVAMPTRLIGSRHVEHTCEHLMKNLYNDRALWTPLLISAESLSLDVALIGSIWLPLGNQRQSRNFFFFFFVNFVWPLCLSGKIRGEQASDLLLIVFYLLQSCDLLSNFKYVGLAPIHFF